MSFIKPLFTVLFISLPCVYAFSQNGLQFYVGAKGGIGYVAPQNHYDNNHYHLNYNTRFNYGANVQIGHGFNEMSGLLADVSYYKVNVSYKGEFDPGFGAGHQSHNKDITLDYISYGLLAKVAASFQDSYVYDTKIQFYLKTGIALNQLLKAKVNYIANGNKVLYPTKLIPYEQDDYPYQPVENSKSLFQNMGLVLILEGGIEAFITDKLAFTSALSGQLTVLDINHKDFRKHKNYKASRAYFGGLSIGLVLYLNR